ncbi:MAG: flagellar biosynthetic protein FliO [Porticoccus sp.]|nr:flagellar biosynthetic protein FliO [Porticoccus sp.]
MLKFLLSYFLSVRVKTDKRGHGYVGIWLLTMTMPVAVLAEEKGGSPSVDIFNTAYLFQVFGSLLVVFGCIFGLIFLLKKLNGIPNSQKAPIRVLGAARVGAREKILLVEAGEQQLLVGVAAGSMRTLHTFDKPIVDSTEIDQKNTDFASLLGSSFASRKAK